MNIPNSEIKLSIAIPTYNGEKYITNALDSIFNQFDEILFKSIEVIVINNASTDNTLTKVSHYLDANKIRLHSHTQNIGFDQNIISAFDLCSGEYILFLGDDDYLDKKCISKIMSVLSQGSYNALLLPVSFHNSLTNHTIFTKKYRTNVTFTNINDFFKQTEFDSSCISSLCFKRISLSSLDIAKHVSSNWIHIAILIESIRSTNKIYCFYENMVTVRIHSTRWENNFGNQLLSGLMHLGLIRSYFKEGFIDSDTYERLSRAKYKQNFKAIIGLKPKLVRDQTQSARIMIKLFYNRYSLWFLDIPLLMLPNPIFKLLLNMFRFLRRFKLHHLPPENQ